VYALLKILHFIGLALGIGTGFATLALGLAARDLQPAERVKFLLRASAVGKNGGLGMGLLLATGIGMTIMGNTVDTFARGGGAFHAKLALVAILAGLLGYVQVLAKRARQAQGGPAMDTIPKVSAAMLVTGVGIVILAVLAFH